MSNKIFQSFSGIIVASVLCFPLCCALPLMNGCGNRTSPPPSVEEVIEEDMTATPIEEETAEDKVVRAKAEADAARVETARAREAAANDAAQRVVQTISGDVFLTIWHNGQFRKFNRSQVRQLDRTKPVVVLVHGLFQSVSDEWLANMAKRIAAVEPNTIILAIDWSKYSLKGSKIVSEAVSVANVVKSIPPVADHAHLYLFGRAGLQLKPERTHIIGFSHGAHVAGLIGESTKGTLRRLTVLDPSSRATHFAKNDNRFGKGWGGQAARFIDMYQTSRVLGTDKPYGHMSWQVVEEGRRQLPIVSFKDISRHNYAPAWFTSTVGNRNLGHGYSMTIPANAVYQEGRWSGTIISK
jgi:hypothetical protein